MSSTGQLHLTPILSNLSIPPRLPTRSHRHLLLPSENFDSDSESIKDFLDDFASTTLVLLNNKGPPNHHSEEPSHHENSPGQLFHDEHSTEYNTATLFHHLGTSPLDDMLYDEAEHVDNLSETPTILASDEDSDQNDLDDSLESARSSPTLLIPSDSMRYKLPCADFEGDNN